MSEVKLSGSRDLLCALNHFCALEKVIAARRVTRSFDFQKYQKYAMFDPHWPVDWVTRLQIFLNTCCAFSPNGPPLSMTKGSKCISSIALYACKYLLTLFSSRSLAAWRGTLAACSC